MRYTQQKNSMHRHLFLFLLVFQSLAVHAISQRTDSLFLVLDKTIQQKAVYADRREQRIDSLKNSLPPTANLSQRFQLYDDIFRQYRYYNMISALSFVEKQTRLASEIGNQSYEFRAMLNNAEIFGIMGMHMEAFDLLNRIDSQKLDNELLLNYFSRHLALYHLIAQNTLAPKQRIQYQQSITHYRDSILMIAEEGSISYKFAKTETLIENGRYDEALALFNQFRAELGNDVSFGTIAHIFSRIYARKGNAEKQKQYLAISAISDLREGVKEHIALRELSVLLYHAGDIGRAYRFAKSAIEDAIFSGAQFRVLEMSEILPIIFDAYEQRIRQENRTLTIFLILTSLLLFLLIISVLITMRQMKKLATAKAILKQTNDDLLLTNRNLDELNAKLLEANRVKETYIGHFLDLCSDYILKLEKFKSTLNKKAMDKKWDELQKVLKSNEIIDSERELLFQNFDRIFLHLYPGFIEGFNALLVEEERFVQKRDELLNTELRIFALIRLGIIDSSKIAQFLDYSPNTIYNYRTRAKNKAAVPREDFEALVMKIGVISE